MIGFRKESLQQLLKRRFKFRLNINLVISPLLKSILFYIILLNVLLPLQASAQDQSTTTSTTVTLTWTSTGDNGLVGNASYYDLRYSLLPINENNWNNATKVTNVQAPRYSGSSESFMVIGLNPNTTYYFAMKVGDEIPNWSVLSNVAVFRTSPPPLCGDIDESGIVDITDLVYFVRYMFVTSYPQFNLNAMDLDLSGGVDISDLLLYVEYLFNNGPKLVCPL